MSAKDDAKRRYEDPEVQAELRRRKEQDWGENTLRPSEVFGQRLQETRKARGLTQAELARRMRDKGYPMSKTALLRIEACERGLLLDEAFALTEALQAVPAYMLTPPEEKLIRLSESIAVDGSGLRQWLVSGLPFRTDQAPPAELVDDVQRERFQLNLVRLALGLVDSVRGNDKPGIRSAGEAIVAEVKRREHEREPEVS